MFERAETGYSPRPDAVSLCAAGRADSLMSGPFGLVEDKFVIGQRHVHLDVHDVHHDAIAIFGAIDIDVAGKQGTLFDLPFAVAGIADDAAIGFEGHLADD